MAVLGKILRFDDVRGYGFIVPDNGGQDVFVHVNDLLDDRAAYEPGSTVEFEVLEGDRGLKAYAVRLTKPPVAGAERVPETVRPPAPMTVLAQDEDGMCDVLAPEEFRQELIDTLLRDLPELTGAQIVRLIDSMLDFSQKHGWIVD
ncbi:cold shock domain-containing protein [Nonomuraea longicatena]|uniref:Cold shock domain-containing protein n=1 Tax=Nonomuraea longicatena TaxID=83682 RepID=A0ABN1NLS3_9ACTN